MKITYGLKIGALYRLVNHLYFHYNFDISQIYKNGKHVFNNDILMFVDCDDKPVYDNKGYIYFDLTLKMVNLSDNKIMYCFFDRNSEIERMLKKGFLFDPVKL